MSQYRVGIGFDTHKLVEGKKLFLGGVEIDFELGFLAHSDGDVLLHAIMDAILGAGSLGDIGQHFPPDKEEYKGISSLKLLGYVKDLINEKGMSIHNIDSIVICDKPRIYEYIDEMKGKIADVLDIGEDDVGIKGTSTEGLGFTGRSEGISALATVLIHDI